MAQDKTEVNILPEHIRASLAKYTEHTNITCLECGYVGLMGIKSKTKKTSTTKKVTYSFLFVGIIFVINVYLTIKGASILPLWISLLGACILVFILGGDINIFECPNCSAKLSEKK